MNASADHIAQEQRAIEALEERESRALLGADISVLQMLWADDLVVNSTANLIAGKEILLEMIRKGRLALRTHERRPVRIVISGDLAVATGNEVSQLIGEIAEYKLFASYMNVWRKREGEWQLVARHLGLIERAKPT
jgi:ketosteroid isomerase-like protein